MTNSVLTGTNRNKLDFGQKKAPDFGGLTNVWRGTRQGVRTPSNRIKRGSRPVAKAQNRPRKTGQALQRGGVQD